MIVNDSFEKTEKSPENERLIESSQSDEHFDGEANSSRMIARLRRRISYIVVALVLSGVLNLALITIFISSKSSHETSKYGKWSFYSTPFRW